MIAAILRAHSVASYLSGFMINVCLVDYDGSCYKMDSQNIAYVTDEFRFHAYHPRCTSFNIHKSTPNKIPKGKSCGWNGDIQRVRTVKLEQRENLQTAATTTCRAFSQFVRQRRYGNLFGDTGIKGYTSEVNHLDSSACIPFQMHPQSQGQIVFLNTA